MPRRRVAGLVGLLLFGARLEEMTLDEVERHLITRALSRHGGNVMEAARALGLSRSALYRRLASHGIPPPKGS